MKISVLHGGGSGSIHPPLTPAVRRESAKELYYPMGTYKKHFLHITPEGGKKAYRVGNYEYDLLLQIMEFEHLDNEAETLRVILREAARARNLHPRLTPLALDTATPSDNEAALRK